MVARFRLIDRDWWEELGRAAHAGRGSVRIVCPFIKVGALEHLLSGTEYSDVRVITRFASDDWAAGVSDPRALQTLLDRKARVRGVQHLHTKLYVFGQQIAILGSANLTTAALTRNHELGVMMCDAASVKSCSRYFDRIWSAAGEDLTSERLRDWIERFGTLARHGRNSPGRQRGPDFGAHVPMLDPSPMSEQPSRAWEGSFVKFFGTTDNRWSGEQTIAEELRRSGCHWACGYPKNRRPRSVPDGAVVFMGRLMKDPPDTRIFGRAIAVPYVPGRDDATVADIRRRAWRRDWPHYIRVLNPEFIDGRLGDGVSLSELMKELGPNSFLSTQRNRESGTGNTDPRSALRRQASMKLTQPAYAWLNDRLQAAFDRHGKLDVARQRGLEWPSHARGLSDDGLRLLRLLWARLRAERINPEDSATLPRYKELVIELGLRPEAGRRVGQQLREHGLDDLDEWTQQYGLPAISGLVVTGVGSRAAPGNTFFEIHGREPNDLAWWSEEVRAAAAYDWTRIANLMT